MGRSVAEINRMRLAVWGLTVVYDHVYSKGELDAQVEERLRTYIANGTTPEELEEALTERSSR